MKTYRCHKVVQAAKVAEVRPINFGCDGELVLDDGSVVGWPDGKTPANVVGGYYVLYEDGYTSWSPAAAFEDGYAEIEAEPASGNFGKALEWLKSGKRVARTGWNGKGLWLEYIPQSRVDLPYIRMSYPVNSIAYLEGARVPWLASQTDMLADDWVIRA